MGIVNPPTIVSFYGAPFKIEHNTENITQYYTWTMYNMLEPNDNNDDIIRLDLDLKNKLKEHLPSCDLEEDKTMTALKGRFSLPIKITK